MKLTSAIDDDDSWILANMTGDHRNIALTNQRRLQAQHEAAEAQLKILLRPTSSELERHYTRWIKMKLWTVDESTMIATGFNPEAIALMSRDTIEFAKRLFPADANLLDGWHRLLCREFPQGQTEPAEFFARAKKLAERLPAALMDAFIQTKTSSPSGEAKRLDTANAFIAAIAKSKGYDPEKKNNAVGILLKTASEYGFKRDADTLRDLFKQAVNSQ